MDNIKRLQKKIKIYFENEKTLLQAITHKSFDPNNNYENLEFLGDRVLGLVISKKNDVVNWDSLKPTIISSINDYFEKNEKPILSKDEHENNNDEKENKNEDLTVKEIKQVLDTKIRPAVAKDGGDIKFVSFNNGTVTVELRGSCSGCPSSLMTLKNGVQNLLKHYVKEVNKVEAL